MGYHRAGFDVVGVDLIPQPNYPFEFHQADAMTYPLDGFDVVHASPPCHDHSPVTGRDRNLKGSKGTGWMLDATIERLSASGIPWVVENVEAAKFPEVPHKVRVCGSSFGLNVRRHRWFASSEPVVALPCDHGWQTPRFRSLSAKQHKAGRLASVVGVHGHLNYAGEFEIRCAAMDVDWMTSDELSQSIPPAYTKHLGRQLIDAVTGGR